LLRADLHIHSMYSDGQPHPKEILYEAINKGIDVVAVTDHDTFRGSLTARRIALSSRLELVVLIAAEIRTSLGDVLVYCPDTPPERMPREPGELADEAHAHGCIIAPAHPFDVFRGGLGDAVYELRGKIDAIEVYNAKSLPVFNEKALEAARLLGLPGIGGSDAHVLDNIGAAYTLIDAEPDPEEVIKAIKHGRVRAGIRRASIRGRLKSVVWSIRRRVRPPRHDWHWEEMY